MKKLLALACAVSVVALTSGASADETGSLTLTGNVAQSIVLTYGAHTGDGAMVGADIDRTITLAAFSTNGSTNAKAGSESYGVVSNVNFTATVTSSKGGTEDWRYWRRVVAYTVGVGGNTAGSCLRHNNYRHIQKLRRRHFDC